MAQKSEKIRIALAGCGRIAKKHISAIKQHDDHLKIVDVCDTDANAVEKTCAQTGATGHASLQSMLSSTKAELVVLTTPSGLHSEQAIQVANTGRHVMTEKPMATNWHDGVRMVKACDDANVKLFVVKQNRRNATLQMLKKAVEQSRFGRIYMVNINVFWTRSQEYYDSAKWRGTWEFDGGAFMNQASHYVDLLDWIIGPVESVQAYTATLARDIEVEDTGVMNIRWRSGALGSMNVTMLTHSKNFEGSITIIGEKGTVRVGGVAVNQIEHWEFDTPYPDDDLVKSASYKIGSVYGFGHASYYENVIKVLKDGDVAETDGREGLRSLEVLIATYLSARDGRRISLPLNF